MPLTPQRNGDGKDILLDRQWPRGPALWGSRTKQSNQGDQPTRRPPWKRGRVEVFFLQPTGDDEGDAGGQAHPRLGGGLQAARHQGRQRRGGSQDAQRHADHHQGSHRPEGAFATKKNRIRLRRFRVGT